MALVFHTRPDELSGYAHGEVPATWNDVSGNANHAILTNIEDSATVRKAASTGLWFDYVEMEGGENGSDEFTLTNELGATGTRTVIQVLRIPSTVQNGGWSQGVIESFVDFNSTGEEHYINFTPVSGARVDFNAGYTGTPTDLFINEFNQQGVFIDKWVVLVLVYENDTLTAYVNSLSNVLGTDTVVGFSPDNVELDLPANIGHTSRMDIAETRVYDEVPADLADIVTTLVLFYFLTTDKNDTVAIAEQVNIVMSQPSQVVIYASTSTVQTIIAKTYY